MSKMHLLQFIKVPSTGIHCHLALVVEGRLLSSLLPIKLNVPCDCLFFISSLCRNMPGKITTDCLKRLFKKIILHRRIRGILWIYAPEHQEEK